MSKSEQSISIKRDTWLSEMLGYPAFAVVVGHGLENFHTELRAVTSLHKRYFIQAKIKTDNIEYLHACEQSGFRIIDTNVQLAKKNGASVEHYDTVSSTKIFRSAQNFDKSAVKDIAACNFIYDRFHQDKRIPEQTAHRIKSEWVGNYFEGTRGHELIVAEIDNQIVGFNLLLWNPSTKTLTIDLIAVDDRARNQGLAKGLIAYGYHHHYEKTGEFAVKYVVGTQIANIPSLRLYQQCGFGIESSQYVLHLHGNE